MVPEGWRRVPIKHACESITDCVNKTAPVVDYETPFKMIRTTNVRNGRVNTEDVRYVTEDTYKQWVRRGKPQTGDIIFTREAPVGEVGILENGDGIFLGQRTMMYRANKSCSDNYFLFYSLLSSFCQKQIEDFSNGGTVAHVRVPDCSEIIINLPPLTEQKKIAQILSTWDKAIITTEQLLANSQQQKKALMQQLLTGKKRLLDNNGVRCSGRWEVAALANLASITMGSSPKSAAYNEKSIGLPLLQGNADIKNRESAPRIYTSQITRKCEKGDILVSVRAPVGSIALSKHVACIGRGIAAVKAKKDTSQSYLYQWLLWFEPKWVSLSQGSTFESINSADLKSLVVQVPPIKEQVRIALVLDSADQEIISLHKKVCSLKTEKKALMQQLLTGKRRVKVEEEAS